MKTCWPRSDPNRWWFGYFPANLGHCSCQILKWRSIGSKYIIECAQEHQYHNINQKNTFSNPIYNVILGYQ
ncbi:hypothetical protein RJT34_07151 [Clitoria ternatea]|uniref:Uncharacterized protein n=1 Tax=Clitoria ternatea TaxID=43366 RepID=A0AAN9PS33_CLITE